MLQRKIAEIHQKRAASDPLPKGSAPYTTSNFFKVQEAGVKPKSKAWSHRFSKEAQRHKASPLKAASRAFRHPDMITLGTARPSPEYFPWEAMSMVCQERDAPGTTSLPSSNVPMQCVRGEDDYDLAVVMNYGYSSGSPQLLRYFTEHIEMIHNPPYDDWESCISCGATSAMEIAFRLFCNAGDTVLMEGFTYAGTVSAAAAQGLHIQGVDMDEFGLIPEDLDRKLETWDSARGRKPFVLYTIPTGQNPTGATQSLSRRKAIYTVAEKHDIYIVEDDPYFFLSLGPKSADASTTDVTDLDGYIRGLPTSYLSLDVSGRVFRIDSTSKILAPGLRLGWVTASSEVIEKFVRHSEVSVAAPSGPSQAMVHKLLDVTWGHEGFIRWCAGLSAQYRHRRDLLVAACERHMPSDLCVWSFPEGGMFLWIDLDLSKFHSATNTTSSVQAYLEIEQVVFNQAQENGVLISPGSWFITDVTQMRGVSFRLTFAAAPEDALDRAVERFGSALKTCFERAKKDMAAVGQGSELPSVPQNPVLANAGISTEREPLKV